MSTAKQGKIALVDDSSRIHPINKGTSYDVPGKLRHLADAIENGHFGRVTDAGLVVRSYKNRNLQLHIRHFGTGNAGDLMLMAERFRQRVAQ